MVQGGVGFGKGWVTNMDGQDEQDGRAGGRTAVRRYDGFGVAVCWVPAPERVEGRPLARMAGGRGTGPFAGKHGLAGCGYGGLGPRFRGDDGGAGDRGGGFRGDDGDLGAGDDGGAGVTGFAGQTGWLVRETGVWVPAFAGMTEGAGDDGGGGGDGLGVRGTDGLEVGMVLWVSLRSAIIWFR